MRARGIEPLIQAWEARVLPLYYARAVFGTHASGISPHPLLLGLSAFNDSDKVGYFQRSTSDEAAVDIGLG